MSNYVVSGTTPMDEIPDHAIQPPFGTSTPTCKIQNERFNKYRHFIIPWFKEIYNVRMYCKGGFECSVCGAWVGNNKSSRILAHLTSLKHLRAALGDELEKSDQSNRRRVSSQHTIHGTPAPVDGIVANETNSLSK